MPGNLPTAVSVGEQSRALSIETNNSPRSKVTGAVHNDETKRSGQEELELFSHDGPTSTDKENATTIHTDAIKPEDNCAIPNYVPPDFDAIMATLLKDEKELTKEQFDEKYPWQKKWPKPRGASPGVAMALVDDILSGEYDRQQDELQLQRKARREARRKAQQGPKEK